MAEAAKKVEEPIDESQEQEVAPSIKPVGINRFGLLAEHANAWRVNCKVETDPKDVEDPAFWEHIAQHLNRGDTIEVMPDDMRWKMLLHVHDKGHNWASVKQMAFFEFGKPADPDVDLPRRYAVEWAGTTERWRVLFNGKKLKSGFATEQLAHRYATNHAEAVKR